MDILKSKNIGKKGYIKLISVYGNDEKVVRTAKASFGNYEQDIKDLGLIRYLMRNGHWQPFEFCRMDFQVKIPIYLARQWLRHRTGCLSADTEISFDLPSKERKHYKLTIKELYDKFQDKNNKRSYLKKESHVEKLDNYKVYTVSELSKLVDRSESTIRELIRKKSLHVVSSNPYLITKTNWIDYINREYDTILPIKLSKRIKNMRIRNVNEDSLDIGHDNIYDVYESGVKDVYKYTFSDGKHIKCTKDHRFFTNCGWKTIKEVEEDSNIKIYSTAIKGDNKNIKNVTFSNSEINSEIWKITKEDSCYEVSNLGRVRNLKTKKILKTSNGKYRDIVNMNYGKNGNIQNAYSVHSLVLSNFIGDRPQGKECCHKDGNCFNNRVENLYWGTSKENSADKKNHNSDTLVRLINVDLISVEYIGKEMTYDITINGKYKNYIANGLVVHNSYNELSGRYKELTNEFEYNNELQKKSCEYSFDVYNENLAINMPKEKARINLPLSTYTTFVFTMDLKNLLHFLKLRLDSHAQKEIRDYADVIYEWVREYFPVIAKAFQDYELNAIKLSALDLDVLSELVSYDFMIKNIIENEQYLIDKKGFGKSEVKDLLAKVEKFKKNNLEKS